MGTFLGELDYDVEGPLVHAITQGDVELDEIVPRSLEHDGFPFDRAASRS